MMAEKCKQLFFAFCAAVFFCGCGVDKRTDTVPSATATRINEIHESLMRGGIGFRHVQETESTDRLFLDIQDENARRIAACRFGDSLLSLDLRSLDYRRRADSTCLYGEYICQCFRLMRKCDVEPSLAMDFLFEGLGRYKSACLDISTEECLAGESRAESRRRRECARTLRDSYRLTLSIFKRFWLPNLSRYLPPEFHDEFRRRLRAFELPPSRPASPPTAQSSGAGDGR